MGQGAFILLIPFLIGFGLFLRFVIILIARIGGWDRLAQHYPAPASLPEMSIFRLRSLKVGQAYYRSVMKVGVGRAGLYLVPVFFFRAAHPPLLIPWSELELSQSTEWMMKLVELTPRKTPDIKINVPLKHFIKWTQPVQSLLAWKNS